jgi:hypothetical protein
MPRALSFVRLPPTLLTKHKPTSWWAAENKRAGKIIPYFGLPPLVSLSLFNLVQLDMGAHED